MLDEIPAHLRDFLAAHIDSIAHLELLLLLRGDPEKTWSAEEAAKALYTGEPVSGLLLEALVGLGLLTVETSSKPRYRFAPKTEALQKIVDDLAELYATRRVSVINLIYSGPEDKLRRFANAFRFRSGGEK